MNEGGYTSYNFASSFSGTSAATPIVAAVAALLLSVRPELTWRDMQGVLAHSTRKNDHLHTDWRTNGAGIEFNEYYGHGVVDADLAVQVALVWPLSDLSTVTIAASDTVTIPTTWASTIECKVPLLNASLYIMM